MTNFYVNFLLVPDHILNVITQIVVNEGQIEATQPDVLPEFGQRNLDI